MAALARLAYSLWAAAAFLTVGVAALLVLAVLPGVARRRAAGRALARAYLRLAGMPVDVRFPERLPQGQCVVVCNHASYLDGIVLTAALPPRFGFVIKREMASVPLAGLALRRLGSEFVERFDRHRGAADTRRLLRNATTGRSLVFFPEGTFTRAPGLLKFHTGAFMTAARVGCPVVPAVLCGTRRALPPSGALPRPGRIELELLAPLTSAVKSPEHAAPELRDRSRAAILASLGEPDLTCSGDTARPPDRARAKSARAS
ncbi:MAG TPA: lysophospholipid acyltransferase family protein [Steroidobacteraceae bacterium]|nr:lysophospholipid acyltransferase family protein [Steroidobacteraceae bacterium]